MVKWMGHRPSRRGQASTSAEGWHRAGWLGILLGCLLLVPISGHAESIEASVDLPAGVRVEHDGAGGLRFVDGARVVLEVTLEWLDGSALDPRGVALDVASGAVSEGVQIDGALRAALPSSTLHDVVLDTRLRHWPYFHVDDIVFVDAALVTDATMPAGAIAVGLRGPEAWELRTLRQRPHLGVGRAPSVEYDLIQTVIDRPDGDRIYLGVVRLDRRRAVLLGEHDGLTFEAGTPPTWPLALIAARTRSSLEYLAGQALLTYDRAGSTTLFDGKWKVPPLCGRCREPRVEDVRIDLRARDGQLILRTRIPREEHLENVSAEGLRVEGIALGRHLQSARGEEAEYRLPLTGNAARRLVDAASTGTLDVEIWMNAGVAVQPQHVEVALDPTTAASLVQARAEQDDPLEDLPSYLSPSLVSSWPNPFRGETTIEVTVPATLGEAFDLDGHSTVRLDPGGPVPFGDAPTVRVRVYNVGGQLVQTLTEEVRSAGRFAVQWNGNDAQGRPVAAGAYYVNVEMGDWSVTKRVLRLAP